MTDPAAEEQRGGKTDGEGRFRIEQLVPGRESTTVVPGYSPGLSSADGTPLGPLPLRAGEARDPGDVRERSPAGGSP